MTDRVQQKIPVILLYGGIASICIVLFTIWAWKGGIDHFLGNVAYLMYLIPVGFAVAGGLIAKKRRQGGIDFRAALKVCFGIIVLTLAVQAFFTWILVHVIDPRFGRELIPAALAKTLATYRHLGMSEDELSRNADALKGSDPFGVRAMAEGQAKLYIVGFLIAALIAALIKNQQPEQAAVKIQ
jgi:hypothetical protein